MRHTHQKLEKRFRWYRDWHKDKLSTFVHYFVLVVFVLAFIFNSFAALFYTQLAKAASPWSIDSDADWDQGSYTDTEANSGNLNLTSQPTWYNSPAQSYYNSSYDYRRKITFDNAAQAENLTDFPVMLKLDNASLAWSGKIQADLDDVIFRDANGSLLKWEWEKKAPTGESIAWVKIPKIDASSNTDYIYMDYGNPSATDQSDAVNVWTNGYAAVWHMNQASGNITDSTGNNTGVANGTLTYNDTSKIGGAIGFDGSTAYFNAGSHSSIDDVTPRTYQAWARPTSDPAGDGWRSIINKFGLNFATYGSQLRYYTGWTSGGYFRSPNDAVAQNQWSFLTTTYAYSTIDDDPIFYKDGSLIATTEITAPVAPKTSDASLDAMIGCSWNCTGYFYQGQLDEVRILSVIRSAPWIAAEFKNQGDNTFATVGSEGTLDGFSYRRTITFDNADQASNLTDFPVMVKLTDDEMNWSSLVQADLDDVIFVDSDNTTLLNYEWETKDSSAESIAWVQVPQIDASSSTDKIYMYYGNASAADQSTIDSVWSNNFAGVWHLNEASGTIYDATSNNKDGSSSGGVTYGAAGKVDSAITLNGTDGYINFPTFGDLQPPCTITAWVYPTADTLQVFVGTSPYSVSLSREATAGGGRLISQYRNGAAAWKNVRGNSANPVPLSSWSQVSLTYTAGVGGKVYLNASDVTTYSDVDNEFYTATTAQLGKNNGGNWLNGTIDEVRISTVERSPDWIAATYLSETDEFITKGPPQTTDTYLYRRKIIFDNSGQASNLTDFPVMVNANNSSLSWNAKIQGDMDDVIFVDADDSTPLSFEWEIENPSGESIAWAKVPQIDGSSNTDFIWMYYGNGSAPDLEHGEGVWTNGYEGVWTLNEGSGNTVYDKTKNGNNGTTQSMDDSNWVAGRAGGYALQFDTPEYVLLDNNASVSAFPVTMIHNLLVDDVAIGRAPYTSDVADIYYGHWTFVYPTSKISINYGAGTGAGGGDRRSKQSDNAVLNLTNWQTMGGTIRGELDMTLYVDGAEVAGTYTGTGGAYDKGTADGSIGKDRTSYFKGKIDNVMYLSRDVSADEIAAYDLVASGSFNTIDSELTHYSTSGTYTSIVKDMGFNSNLTLLNSSYTLNGGTATYSIRTGPTSVPDGSWTGWIAVSPGGDPSSSLDDNRYAQIKIDLTSPGDDSPDIDSVTLSYESVAGSSSITSPVNGAVLGPGNISIEGTAQSNQGAAIKRVEVSTNGGGAWSTAYTGGWSDAAAWNDWLYRQKITINKDEVDDNLTDFPVLISITSEDNPLFGKAQTDGDDIAFTQDDKTTQLSHEIESYVTTPGSRQLIAWVKSDLSSSTDTDLYMYYGNSTCGSQQDVINVWDSNYKSVLHSGETSGDLQDSTTNNRDSSLSGGITRGAAGKVGSAVNYDGTGMGTIIGTSPLNLGATGDKFSFETWINQTSPMTRRGIVTKAANSGAGTPKFDLRTEATGIVTFAYRVAFSWHMWATTDPVITGDSWHHIAVNYTYGTGSSFQLFIDGDLKSGSWTSGDGNIAPNASDHDLNTAFVNLNYYFLGTIDETRFSVGATRPTGWISTEFNNQDNPSSFASPSSEEARGEAQPGGNTWSYIWNVTTTGSYNLLSRVVNEDNVTETPGAGVTVTIDADLPTSTIGYPTSGSGYYSPNLLVTGTANDTGGAVVSALDLRVREQGGGTVQDWAGATNTGTNFSTWSYSNDGLLQNDTTYIIESRATDSVGNIQSPVTSSTINVDLTYPSSSITSPSMDDKFKVEDRTIEGTATANNGQPLSNVQMRIQKLDPANLDTQKTTATTQGKTQIQGWTTVSGTDSWFYNIPSSIFTTNGGGYYQIQSRATNQVNLTETPSPGITVLVDDTPPTTPTSLMARDVSNLSQDVPAIYLSFNPSTDSETRVSQYETTVNGSSTTYSLSTAASQKDNQNNPVSLILTQDQGVKTGDNTLSIKAQDEVDNSSDSTSTQSVTVESKQAEIADIKIQNIDKVTGQRGEEKTSTLVTYKTDISSSTLVFYDKGDPDRDKGTTRYFSDPSLNYTHTAILSDLEPDTAYKLKIEGLDAYGNKLSSDLKSFRSTPKPEEDSIFHIIARAFRDMFAWVKRVMAAPFQEKQNPDQDTEEYLSLKALDTSEAEETNNQTETPQVALAFKKNETLSKNDQAFEGENQETTQNSYQPATNLLDPDLGIALDTNPTEGEKTTYKLDNKDNSEKTLYPGKESEISPEIKDIETKEILTTEDSAEYLITFKTHKPCKAAISSSKGQLKAEGSELEAGEAYNLSHSFYLDNLTPGETIKYTLTTTTKYQKETKSGEKSFTVPKKVEERGLWRIIVDALLGAFDWFKGLSDKFFGQR